MKVVFSAKKSFDADYSEQFIVGAYRILFSNTHFFYYKNSLKKIEAQNAPNVKTL